MIELTLIFAVVFVILLVLFIGWSIKTMYQMGQDAAKAIQDKHREHRKERDL